MDEMELLERELLMNLKSRFFDLLYTDGGSLSYEDLLEGMLVILQNSIHVDEVTLYNCDEMNPFIMIEASTNKEIKNSVQNLFIPSKEFTEFIGDRSVIYLQESFPYLQRYDLILPLQKDEVKLGYLALKGLTAWYYSDEEITNVAKECALLLYKAKSIYEIIIKEKRYKQLFRVTEKFHSTMDMDAVLEEIIDTLQEEFPSFTYYLMLSHDNKNYKNLPIKDLEYDSENISAMQAYVTGLIQLEDSIQERKSILYAPLKGKQGVYGVLQVIAPNTTMFPKSEVEFMSLLANTAGSALENAKLYQQSRNLVSDLQLINETTHRLNSDLRLSETISYMTDQIISSLSAEVVAFILYSEDLTGIKIIKGSSPFFFTDEAEIYLEYISRKIQNERDSLFVGDLGFEDESLYRSIMAVPMVQAGTIKGFALVMHHEPYHFTFDTFKLLQSLIHHSTLAFTNSILREELEIMVITDHLTKLSSRSFMNDKINESMSADEYGTFILVDIDNFKQINDTYGHQVGDEVLIQVSAIIKNHIRDTDSAARWGGEELAVYLPNTTLAAGVLIAERLVEHVEAKTNPRITISCGVSFWKKEEDDSFTRLFKRADDALYEAKGTGKNKVVTQKNSGLTV